MGKSRRNKFYAVKVGREGPRIYSTWEEAKENIYKYPGSQQKSFHSRRDAEEWLNIAPEQTLPPRPPASHLEWHPRQGATYAGSTHWQRHRTTSTGWPRSTAPGYGPTHNYKPFPVKTEEDVSLREEARRFVLGLAHGFPNTADNIPRTAPYQQGAGPPDTNVVKEEQRDAIMAKEEPVDPLLPLVKEESKEGVLAEASQPRAGDVNTMPYCKAEEAVRADSSLAGVAAAPVPGPPPVVLSNEQQEVLDMVRSGRNVFFTGSAGTGKTVLLKEIIRVHGDRYSGTLAITAATGIAAVSMGGCTLHSWAGIGLGKESAEKLVGKFLGQDSYNREHWQEERAYTGTALRWRKVKTLIIDEISMIDGVLFDKLEFIARELRCSEMPFGGIQLVLSGDFCQLPPVPDRDEHGASIPATFAFEAESWKRCVHRLFILRHVFRQSDQKFVDMLNSVRFGRVTSQITEEFRKLSRRVVYDDGIEPTDLCPTRQEADSINVARLNRLKGIQFNFPAKDLPGVDEYSRPYPPYKVNAALGRLVAPKDITLKIGAHVMLIKNMVQGQLVNGSLGHVVGFNTVVRARASGTDIAKEDPEKNHGRKPGISTSSAIDGFVWPLVKFQTGQTLLCVPATFEAINAANRVEATRFQVPLILAWALSIHKSQGQTLSRVRVNLRRVFEKGQAYVALSRATSMDGLQVLGFQSDKIEAHPRVVAWMREVMGEELFPPLENEPIIEPLQHTRAEPVYHTRAEPIKPEPTWDEPARTVAKDVVSAKAEPVEVNPSGDSDDDDQYWAAFGE